MAQRTRVIQVSPAERDALRQSVASGAFEHRAVPHALFSVKGDGVVATLYTSGKLVIQGADPDVFAAQYLGRPAEATRPARDIAPDVPLVGTDEAGKGDYFGPLVVAGVRLLPGEAHELERARVTDSKKLSDETVLRLGAALRAKYPHAIARLDPPRYNEVYGQRGKLNQVLADLHVEVIRELSREGDSVLVDQFAHESLLEERTRGLGIALIQRHRAEEVMAVAAASCIAREQFLVALKALSDESGVDLHKGAGDPVDKAGVEFVRIHGWPGLKNVAKLHFKNTEKVRERIARRP